MAEGRRFCENCGTQIGETTNFCPNCGAAQSPDPEVPTGPPPPTPEPGRIGTPYAPDVPPAPQAQGGRRRWSRILAIGCGALLLLFLLLVACAALIGGGGGGGSTTSSQTEDTAEEKKETAQKQSKQETKKKAKQDQASTVAAGQPVNAGDIEWTVTNAQRTNQLSQESFGQFGQTKQGDFVVVDLSFRNNGSDPTTLTTNSLTLLDSADRESRPDTDTFGYIEPERNVLLEQVNPGVTREGTVIFSVSPDASGFRLRLGDTKVFGSEEAYVDLGL